MTRTSIVVREAHRAKLRNKHGNARKAIKEALREGYKKLADPKLAADAYKENAMLHQKLEKLPLNSAPIRARRRCALTGRPRGNYRKFNLCRIKLRELAMQGQIPGIKKSSW